MGKDIVGERSLMGVGKGSEGFIILGGVWK